MNSNSKDFSLETIEVDGEPRLVIRDLTDDALTPLSVDFSSGELLHRLRTGVSKNQPLAKAIGLKSLTADPPLSVIDATAGLGTDALMLAALGCRVRAIERSETIFQLLQDGERRLRASADEKLRAIATRLTFERGDAISVLAHLGESARPDVIYLDPMYPDEGKHKSALPKKTMQIFRKLLDGDQDAERLWEVAMGAALQRVVVKRPLKAPALGSRKPTHTFEGKTARLDMYLV